MLLSSVLAGCGLEPPLTFDELLVGELTFEVLTGDLAFQVEDEGRDGTVETLDYTVAVEETPIYEDQYQADSEVEARVVLAPMAVAYRDVFEVSDLFHADDLVPFEITGRYTFQTAFMSVEYVLVQSGTMPAPRAPRFEPLRLSSANLVVEVSNDNVDGVQIALQGATVEVDGELHTAVDPPPFDVEGGGSTTIDLPLAPVGSGWDGREIEVRLRSEAVVDTVFGPIPLTVDQTVTLD